MYNAVDIVEACAVCLRLTRNKNFMQQGNSLVTVASMGNCFYKFDIQLTIRVC